MIKSIYISNNGYTLLEYGSISKHKTETAVTTKYLKESLPVYQTPCHFAVSHFQLPVSIIDTALIYFLTIEITSRKNN